MSEVNLANANKEQLIAAAEKLGIAIDGRWGEDKLREEIGNELEVKKLAEQKAAENAARLQAEAEAEAAAKEGEIKSPVEPTKMPSLADALAASAPEEVDLTDETSGQRRNRLRREATALVRVRISCMNPAKKSLKGELLCVSNRNFGTIQRFVPFNREWHIEKVLYDAFAAREYMVFDREKTGRAGIEVVTPRQVPEFNIQVLPPLTKGELKDLAQRQAMASGTQEQ